MKFEKDTIDRLSRLAKIELNTQEEAAMANELTTIVGFIEQLNEVDTQAVEPTSHITGLSNITRPDEANYTFEKSDMIASMPETDEQGNLRVHAVFTKDSPSHEV